jgi:hypothetical protein
LPQAFGTAATRIDGDPELPGYFGAMEATLGEFYDSGYSTLVVVASSTTTSGGTLAGRIFAFGGGRGTPEFIELSSARHVLDGTVASHYLGSDGVVLLEGAGSSGQSVLAVPHQYVGVPYVELLTGTTGSGPFASSTTLSTTNGSAGRAFGKFVAGGKKSILGSASRDVVVSTETDGLPSVYVVDGGALSFGSTIQIESVAAIEVPIPVPAGRAWTGFSRQVMGATDVDGDGYGDIALAEVSLSSPLPDGRVLILR